MRGAFGAHTAASRTDMGATVTKEVACGSSDRILNE